MRNGTAIAATLPNGSATQHWIARLIRLTLRPAATTRRCRIDRITEQTGDRHRTDAARDGSNGSCRLPRFHESDVTGEGRTPGIIRDAIDADVDHEGAGFDPFATDHLAPAHRSHQYIRGPRQSREVPGF